MATSLDETPDKLTTPKIKSKLTTPKIKSIGQTDSVIALTQEPSAVGAQTPPARTSIQDSLRSLASAGKGGFASHAPVFDTSRIVSDREYRQAVWLCADSWIIMFNRRLEVRGSARVTPLKPQGESLKAISG